MIKQITKHFVALFGLELRKSNSPRFNALGSLNIPYDEWERRDNKYYLKVFDLQVNNLDSPLIAGYNTAKSICQLGGGNFFYDDNGGLRLSIQGVNFFVNFPDELFVINEVFVTGDYNFRTTDQIVVIDVGLNIGATSLFFSKQENVKRVYAYELFQPTYLTAQQNLSLNDATKIVSLNVGLGKEAKQLVIPYSFTSKAIMGLNGLPDSVKFPDATEVMVTLQDAAEEVIRINELEQGVRKVCKMDCEGSEFEILDRLFQKNVVGLIDVYIIEWHLQDTQNIELQFLKNGFDVVKSTTGYSKTGLIYAFKKAGKSHN
jgi:FkbM family methyltransferase